MSFPSIEWTTNPIETPAVSHNSLTQTHACRRVPPSDQPLAESQVEAQGGRFRGRANGLLFLMWICAKLTKHPLMQKYRCAWSILCCADSPLSSTCCHGRWGTLGRHSPTGRMGGWSSGRSMCCRANTWTAGRMVHKQHMPTSMWADEMTPRLAV